MSQVYICALWEYINKPIVSIVVISNNIEGYSSIKCDFTGYSRKYQTELWAKVLQHLCSYQSVLQEHTDETANIVVTSDNIEV